jgi:hypothetical protein
METVSVEHEDGTVDTTQRASVGVVLDGRPLEQLYWAATRRSTLGLVRFSGSALRLLGVWPVLLRFGPLVGGRRVILGGLMARRPGGTIAWGADGVYASVEIEGFSPSLRGPLWRLELVSHDLVGRRFLALVARDGRAE